jgi:hypothetical protein
MSPLAAAPLHQQRYTSSCPRERTCASKIIPYCNFYGCPMRCKPVQVTGVVSTSLMGKRLGAFPQQNRLALALREIGRSRPAEIRGDLDAGRWLTREVGHRPGGRGSRRVAVMVDVMILDPCFGSRQRARGRRQPERVSGWRVKIRRRLWSRDSRSKLLLALRHDSPRDAGQRSRVRRWWRPRSVPCLARWSRRNLRLP